MFLMVFPCHFKNFSSRNQLPEFHKFLKMVTYNDREFFARDVKQQFVRVEWICIAHCLQNGNVC